MGPYTAGIDLGTTNAAAAVYSEGMTRAVRLEPDGRTSPSQVTPIGPLHEWPVGKAAEGLRPLAQWFKRELGTGYPIYLDDMAVEPETLLQAQLQWVLGTIRLQLRAEPEAVTLTHPAGWRPYRTGLLKEIAERAGLQAVSLQTEPVAAASFYASQVLVPEGAIFAVFDLGGGTTDVTIMKKEPQEFVTLATSGSDQGSLDFDDQVVMLIKEELGAGAQFDPIALRRLATQAKVELSEQPETTVRLAVAGVDHEIHLTRASFETAIQPLARAGLAHLSAALEWAGLEPSGLDTVLLAGAGANTPMVGRLITDLVGQAPTRPRWPKMAVCFGAAIGAAGSIGLLVSGQRSVRSESPRPAEATPPPPAPPMAPGSLADQTDPSLGDGGIPVNTRGLAKGPPLVDLSNLESAQHRRSRGGPGIAPLGDRLTPARPQGTHARPPASPTARPPAGPAGASPGAGGRGFGPGPAPVGRSGSAPAAGPGPGPATPPTGPGFAPAGPDLHGVPGSADSDSTFRSSEPGFQSMETSQHPAAAGHQPGPADPTSFGPVPNQPRTSTLRRRIAAVEAWLADLGPLELFLLTLSATFVVGVVALLVL